MLRIAFVAPALLASTAFALSCSSKESGSSSGAGGEGGSVVAAAGAPATGGTPSFGGSGFGNAPSFGGAPAGLLEGVDGRAGSGSGSVIPILPGDECAGQVFEGESLPLELLLMMDRSVSMGDDRAEYLLPGGGLKWDAVRVGLEDFFELPQAQGLSAGIDFFSQGSCDPEDYSTPEVPIGPVPSAAPEILAAYDGHSPGENTPIGPALEGALLAARAWREARATEVAVVLITDGVPNGCGTDTAHPHEAAALIAPTAAEYAAGTPPVPTYVLGIQGIEVPADDFHHVVTTIAEAGGTEPVIVEATDDLAAEFAAALEGIRAEAAPPCSYSVPLPPGGEELDLSRVNVVLTPKSSGPEPILNVPGPDACEHGGWYYDPPEDPEGIRLCPNTCDVVSTLTGAGFRVVFGCATVSVIR